MDFGNYEWSSGVKAPNPACVVPVPLLELKADTGLWASHFPVSVQYSISEEHVQVKCHLTGDRNDASSEAYCLIAAPVGVTVCIK